MFISGSVVSAFSVNLADESKPVNHDNCLYASANGEKQPNNIITFSRSSDQDRLIAEMIQKINEDEIYSIVYSLQNFTTRQYGYLGNNAASTWLYNKLDNIPGLFVEYQGGEEYRNVIATLPGQNNSSTSIYMVGAHYDSKNNVNPSYSPGATDNGGGVAIVLEFARIMSQYTFNHTLMFALWNAEEGTAPRHGSHVYVDYAIANNLNIALYINFDSSCYDPDNRFILDIIYNNQSQWVRDMMTQYNSIYNIGFTLTYNVHLSCWSDYKSFWNHEYTAVTTHAETHGPAHTERDTVDKVSTLYAKKNGQLGMSVLANLSKIQQNQRPATPETPWKKTRLIKNYKFCTKTFDPDGDKVWLYWDWGDGSQSGWFGPYNNNETSCATHSWNKKGSYAIKVKAKDKNDLESDWASLNINISHSKIFSKPSIIDLFDKYYSIFPIL